VTYFRNENQNGSLDEELSNKEELNKYQGFFTQYHLIQPEYLLYNIENIISFHFKSNVLKKGRNSLFVTSFTSLM